MINLTAPTMLADGKAVVAQRAGTASLLGTWVNALPDTECIATTVVTERDGALLVRPFGSAVDGLVDWGEVEATPYVFPGTTNVGGFHATYELGAVHTELAANEKQGILVLQSYTSFHDGSGRLSQYSREFFHRKLPDEPEGGGGWAGLAPLVGDWVNSLTTTEWIKGFTLAGEADAYTLRVRAAMGPADWGEVDVVPHQDSAGHGAFFAVYDLGSTEAKLAANLAKGLIIIAAFFRSKDSGDTDFFSREFFFRER